MICATLPALVMLVRPVPADDWTNAGGNAGRNGQTGELGPDAADVLWSTGPSTIICWQPVIEGNRVFAVRQSGFPPGGEPNGSPIYAYDLDTGAVLWSVNIPYNSGDWTTWVAGVKNGLVFASRSGNGASVSAVLYALDAATGAVAWTSDDEIDAGPYDGVVFAPDGDPIIASFTTIKRFNAEDGTTVWSVPRVCSVSGNCGGALFGDALYIADAVPGGHKVFRHDLATGVRQYGSAVLPGFTLQNSPMVGPDGTVYLARVQNNATVDYFYALVDEDGTLTQRWGVPARWTTSSEFGVGPDGSVYMIGAGDVIQRLDPATGAVLNSSAPLATDSPGGNLTPRMAVDRDGRLFVSNGQFSTGRFYSFNADLSSRWDVSVPNINIGAPAVGERGTLVIARLNVVRAYRTIRPCPADLDDDGYVGIADLSILLTYYGTSSGATPEQGDLDGDGDVDLADLSALLESYGTACP
ncbi:MAG: PQQ-binding-like beta-propeller repeat protein [Phycisphaerae bacterium]